MTKMDDCRLTTSVLLLAMTCAVIAADLAQFVPVIHPQKNVPVCAVDPPSAVMSLADAAVGIPPEVPETVKCSYGCSGYFGCTSFNYRSDPSRCELFTYSMKNCSTPVTETCVHFQAKNLQPPSCMPIVAGGWGNWTDKTSCSVVGQRNSTVVRYCNNPPPANGGLMCVTSIGGPALTEFIYPLCDTCDIACTSNCSINGYLTCDDACAAGFKLNRTTQTCDDFTLLYPYGPGANDSSGSFSDCNDGFTTTPLIVSPGFNFFTKLQNVIYISMNGLITFGYGNNAYSPYSIPSGFNSITVYMARVLSTCAKSDDSIGNIFYRISTDPELLTLASMQILKHFEAPDLGNFKPSWLVIVTWSGLTYYSGGSDTTTNTFQAVLASDGRYSFVMMNYAQLSWYCDLAAAGLGGTPAVMGVDAGDGIHYFSHPWSKTADIVNLAKSTNGETIGRFMFRVDLINVQLPNTLDETVSSQNTSVPLLYPYGNSAGDQFLTPPGSNNNFHSDKLTILPAFMFYNKAQPYIQFSDNGWFGFNWINDAYTPTRNFPSGLTRLAVFWADVDLFVTGKLYYRVTRDAAILTMAAHDVQRGFADSNMYFFKPAWALIVTWDSVTYYGGRRNRTNTFQAVLITDGLLSFAIFNYKELVWTTGTWSGGSVDGLSATPTAVAAAVGFDNGDGKRSYLHPWSLSGDILKLTTSSNVGVNGRWVYRVDGMNILSPNYPVPSSTAGSLISLSAIAQSALMYPFALSAGDTTVTSVMWANCDDGAVQIPGTQDFPYFGAYQSDVYVNTNGILSFDSVQTAPCATSFTTGVKKLAIYWNNIHPICGINGIGTLSYRLSTDATMLARVSRDVQLAFPSTQQFNAQWMLVVTWANVALWTTPAPPAVNTFQIVLGTDGNKTFVIFNYDQLQWTPPSSCGTTLTA